MMQYFEPERLLLQVRWSGRPRTLREFCDDVREFWMRLKSEIPELGADWRLKGGSIYGELDERGESIDAFVARDGWDRQARHLYHPKPVGVVLTPGSVGDVGFFVSVETLHSDVSDRAIINVSGGGNSHKPRSSVGINLPLAFSEQAELTEHLMRLMVRYWQPAIGHVDPTWLRNAVFDGELEFQHQEVRKHIFWKHYLNKPGFCDALGPDFDCQQFEQGVMISTQGDFPKVGDEAAVQLAQDLNLALSKLLL